jgi:hypothetical protein
MYEAMQKLMDISSKPLKIIDDNGTVVGTMFIEKCDYKSGHFSETGYHSYYQQHIDVRARFYPEKSEKHKDNSRTVTGARAVVMVNGKEIGRFDNVTIGHKHNPCHEISRDSVDALHYMTGSREWKIPKPQDMIVGHTHKSNGDVDTKGLHPLDIYERNYSWSNRQSGKTAAVDDYLKKKLGEKKSPEDTAVVQLVNMKPVFPTPADDIEKMRQQFREALASCKEQFKVPIFDDMIPKPPLPEDPVINGAWAKAVKENLDKLKSGEEFPGIRKIGEPIEFGSAYVKPNEINGFTEVCMIGGGGGSQKKKCPGHEFKEYVGFTQSYRYCIHCDTKENV